MPTSATIPTSDAASPGEGWSAWRWTLALVLGATLARLAYLVWGCPYGLVEDEAYYWLWSRHLDWSYLTKGPGVALTIRLGTLLLGDTEAGVRLTSPVWGALLALGVAGAAGELATAGRRGSARLWGAAMALLSPPMQATSLLMTIDGPMLACWALGTWAGVRAVGRGGAWAWLGVGAAVATGVLFKPTIGLVVPGVVLAALLCRHTLPRGWWAWALMGVGVSALGLLPLAIWNASHDWALVRHLEEHLRAEGGRGVPAGPMLWRRLGWMSEYAGLMLVLGGPGLVVGLARVWIALRLCKPGAGQREELASARGWTVVALASVPVLLLYLVISALTRVEGNWALGGLVPLLAAVGFAAAEVRVGWWKHGVRACVVIGVVTGLGMLRLDVPARWEVLRGMVPLGRVMSGPIIARGVAELSEEVRGPDGGVVVIADHYGTASLLAFYLEGMGASWRATCWSSSGKVTQFDLWDQTRLDGPRFEGCDAVLVGGRAERWERLFERVEDRGVLEDDHRKRRVFVGRGMLTNRGDGVR